MPFAQFVKLNSPSKLDFRLHKFTYFMYLKSTIGVGMSENENVQIETNTQKLPSLGKIASALAKAQGEMNAPPKNKTNPFFHSKYADLSDCIESSKKILAKYGLAVSQCLKGEVMSPYLQTLLIHDSGEFLESIYWLKKNDNPQKFGSEITYARRYSYCAIIGISADDDDDGNGASDPKSKNKKNSTQWNPKGMTTPKPSGAVNDESKRDEPSHASLPPTESGSSTCLYEQCADFKLRLGKTDHPNYGKRLGDIETKDLHILKGWIEKMPNQNGAAIETLWYVKHFLELDKNLNK